MKFWALGIVVFLFSSCQLQSNYREKSPQTGGSSYSDPVEIGEPVLSNNAPSTQNDDDLVVSESADAASTDVVETLVDEALYASAEAAQGTARQEVVKCIRVLDAIGQWIRICRLVADPPAPQPTPNNTSIQPHHQ